MRVAFLLIFIALPMLEIALLIKTGQLIGFWPTVGIVIATAVLGTTLLRQQGFRVLGRISADVAAGKTPLEPIADGAMILVAGGLLLAPGILTDCLGLALLIPPVRAGVRHFIFRRLLQSPTVVVDVFTGEATGRQREWKRGRERPERAGPARAPDGSVVIEGEFERIDDPPQDPRRR